MSWSRRWVDTACLASSARRSCCVARGQAHARARVVESTVSASADVVLVQRQSRAFQRHRRWSAKALPISDIVACKRLRRAHGLCQRRATWSLLATHVVSHLLFRSIVGRGFAILPRSPPSQTWCRPHPYVDHKLGRRRCDAAQRMDGSDGRTPALCGSSRTSNYLMRRARCLLGMSVGIAQHPKSERYDRGQAIRLLESLNH